MANTAPRFAALLEQERERPAFHCAGFTATRGELATASERAAAHLASLGFSRGDVLAVCLPDGGAWLQLLFACARLGVLMVPITTRYHVQETRHVVEASRAKGIAVTAEFLGVGYAALAREIQSAVPGLAHIIDVPEAAKFLAVDAALPPAPSTGEPGDPLCIFSTSGTTGNPKLAVHDQQGIAQHAQNAARELAIGKDSVLLCALQLPGVYGFVQALAAMAGGACCVFLQVYSTQAVVDAIAKFRATHFFSSDGMFDAVMNMPRADFKTWRYGGLADFAGYADQVVARAEKEFGIRLVGLYGSSECFALTSAQRYDDPLAQRCRSGGRPMPGIEVRAAHVDSGAVLPDGERGELQFRGYNVMTGYLNNPAATAGAFTPDGWLKSGDLGYTEKDRFIYLSRLKDSLRLRGFLVDPTEIEEFLATHAEVIDAQVVGVNRVGEGDMAIAFVRKRNAALDEAQLLAFCKAGIAGFKVPRRIVFVDSYPSSEGPNGTKILKNRIREMAERLV